MISKLPPLDIPEEEPFRHDVLNRRESAEILTDFLSTIDQPFVLAVESSFGMGKTTFLHMWRTYLRQNQFPVLYFNAWETDFTGDPLISFIGEMAAQMKTMGGSESKTKEYLSKAKELAGALARRSVPAAIKIPSAELGDLEKLTEPTLGDLAAKMVQERIDNYERDKTTIKGFKDRLATFIKELSTDNEKVKNVIVLIDELDRCRPGYAVELLEKIKHIFNVPGLIFVLSIDRDQLAHSVRSLYGPGMNADGYLRRFIDLEYRLPQPLGEPFCKSLCKRFDLEPFFKTRTGESQYDRQQFTEYFSLLAGLLRLSLRVQEQIFTQLSIALRTVKANYFIYPPVFATLLALKASNLDLYRKLIEGWANAADVIDFLNSQPGGKQFFENNDRRNGIELEAYLIAATHSERDKDRLVSLYNAQATNATQERERQRAEQLAYFFSHFATRNKWGIISYLGKKIEIAERFVEP
jgi:hypothetical protein